MTNNDKPGQACQKDSTKTVNCFGQVLTRMTEFSKIYFGMRFYFEDH